MKSPRCGSGRRLPAIMLAATALPLLLSGCSTLDGLFVLIAGEERAIRSDPAARVSDPLQRLFAER